MPQDKKTGPKPFENSLSALAQVAVHESAAKGYAFFRKDPAASTVILLVAEGADIGPQDVSNHPGNILVYELGTDGLLVLAFGNEAHLAEGRVRLDRILSAIQAVWKAARESVEYSQLASRVGDLEVHLIDSKIADRVRGLLTQFQSNSTVVSGAVDAIGKHVEGVLRPPSAKRLLRQLTRELEEQVEERRLTDRAKAILRSEHGMSEEQAHEHLRRASRQSRRKLKEIAADLIGQQPLERMARSSQ